MSLGALVATLTRDVPDFAEGWDASPDTRTLGHLRDAITGLSNCFYPAGSGAYEGDVHYFLEREWRIISRLVHHGVALTEKVNPTLRLRDRDDCSMI